ncbi:MAG: hypothetical protein QM765_35725 [Myxococcales bacterium]
MARWSWCGRSKTSFSFEALAWFGPEGERTQLVLPRSLACESCKLVEANEESALLAVDGKRGLAVVSQKRRSALLPDLELHWIDAHHARRLFVVRAPERGVLFLEDGHAIRVDSGGDDAGSPTLDRAAFSEDGAWLALRWKTERKQEAVVSLWSVEEGAEVARYPVRRIEGAVWNRDSSDLAVDERGHVLTATAPSVYGFFDKQGVLEREVCVLPEGEWIQRTRTEWSHSPAAFRWGALRVRGPVLDEAGAVAALGPAKTKMG